MQLNSGSFILAKNKNTNTLYWHDYETFGIDPKRDRAVQFAGIRTDEELNIIGEPLQWSEDLKYPTDFPGNSGKGY